MVQQRFETHGDPAVSAIERVLEAERASEERLRDCKRRAQALVAAARDRAEAIRRRAGARISKLHASYHRRIAQDIAALGGPPASTAEISEGRRDVAALRQAAERLAAKLTGGEDESPR